MNDVMKKRLIGVAILVIIGVLAPLLLSRCMHGGSEDNGRGSMRVYDVQPDGKAKPADNSQSDQGGTSDQGANPDQTRPAAGGDDSGKQASGQVSSPDAVSPQSTSDFSTPPVHGVTGGSSTPSQPTTASSNSDAQSNKPAPTGDAPSSAASNSAGSRPQASASSHDYGSSSVGSGSSSGGQRSSGSNASSSASASGVKKSSIQGWVVQVASFSEQGNAADLARKLKGQFPASYTPGQVNGKTWYRVNVGPFDSKQAAQSAADRLSQIGHKGLVRHLP